MDIFRIKGPCVLNGKIEISGAKNAALPEMSAALLTDQPIELDNIPNVWDVRTLSKILGLIGYDVEFEEKRCRLKQKGTITPIAPYELVRTMRASVLCLGPLVARFHWAEVSLPGGCAIGARPVNMHIEGLEHMGAEIKIEHGYIKAKTKGLKGVDYTFEKVTVTGTENLMMAATLAEGKTILNNCAVEPEVEDLGEMLISMGARIKGLGTRTIEIEGVKELSGTSHRVIPDRIEAGTYLVAGAITNGSLEIQKCRPKHMRAILDVLKEAGVHIEETAETIVLKSNGTLRGVNITTNPYPAFPTDMQAQLMALLTKAEGISIIKETIFENRFLHAQELNRMGANIRIYGNTAFITGQTQLNGADVTASDLRASACLVLAALAAQGQTIIHRIYYLDRGYEKMEEKLNKVGGRIWREKE